MTWTAVTFIGSLLIGVLRYATCRSRFVQTVTPDGVEYLKIGSGRQSQSPFVYRLLLPLLLEGDPLTWVRFSCVCQVATCPALAAYLMCLGFSQGYALAGVVIWCGLLGVFDLPAAFPVLTDAAAHLVTLVVACLWLSGHSTLAIVVSLIGGLIRETIPLWAALLAWHPGPLIGVASHLILRLLLPHRSRSKTNAIGNAMKVHAADWTDPRKLLLPWGVCLLAFGSGDIRAVTCMVAGYAMLTVANDCQRIYQQGAAAVIAGTVSMIPIGLLIPACVVQWFLYGWLYGRSKELPGV